MAMTRRRIAIIGLSAAALAAGTGAAVGATGALKDREQSILEDAAKELGTSPGELREALGNAQDQALDDAVEEGRLTQEQADRIKERRADSGLVLGPPHRRGHHRPGGPGRGPGLIGDVAEAVGLEPRALMERLRDGETLEEIATAENTTVDDVRSKARAAAAERLDEAVADERLTREQADRVLEHVDERLDALAGGEPLPRPGRFGPGGPRDRGGPESENENGAFDGAAAGELGSA